MDAGYNIYELDAEQKAWIDGDAISDGETMTEKQVATLREDVARLDGFLKGRAESDRRAHERLVHDSAAGTYRKPC